jgi:predicted SprT family Zn-dependent metalloprotease
MRSAAGRAWLQHCRIDINPKLRTIAAEEIDRTLRHELAHLIAWQRTGNRRIQAHGEEWRQACRELDIPGEKATHQLPLPIRRQRKRYSYRCRGCQRVVRRVREIQRPTACGTCCRTRNNGRFNEAFILEKIGSANDTSHP